MRFGTAGPDTQGRAGRGPWEDFTVRGDRTVGSGRWSQGPPCLDGRAWGGVGGRERGAQGSCPPLPQPPTQGENLFPDPFPLM